MYAYTPTHKKVALAGLAAASAMLVMAVPRLAAACTPTGLIYDKWQALYGDFGPCEDDAESDGAGGYIEHFEYGYIDWIYPESAAYGCWGLIGSAWNSRYGGPATTGQTNADEAAFRSGAICTFTWAPSGAELYLVWNPGGGGYGSSCSTNTDNVCEVYGRIGQVWSGISAAGAPIDEIYDWSANHLRQDFQNMYFIYNTSDGATCVYDNDGTLVQSDGSC
jgi:hypothetical protein